jgi:arylformamidase
MPEKGPLVFRDYDQATLDAAYDQAPYAPNREQLIRRRASDSAAARADRGARARRIRDGRDREARHLSCR